MYGRERLGEFWGYLAGWAFVVGKTASCAAMALTVGAYVWPGQAHAVAVAAVVLVTAVDYGGVQKSAWVTRVIVGVVLAVLASVVVVCLTSGTPTRAGCTRACRARPAGCSRRPVCCSSRSPGTRGSRPSARRCGIRRAPSRGRYGFRWLSRWPRTWLSPSPSFLSWVGGSLGASVAPLADAVRAAGVPGLAPVVRVGAAVAALGSLLALLLGVSRTTLAMARDRHLPGPLAAVHPRFHVPHRAALAVGGVVAVLAAVVDVRGAVGFSSFGVLTYYAVANASAWTLRPGSRPGWCRRWASPGA